jgi:hypothetical protein
MHTVVTTTYLSMAVIYDRKLFIAFQCGDFISSVHS